MYLLIRNQEFQKFVATCWFANIMDSVVYKDLLMAQAKKMGTHPELINRFSQRDGI